MYRILIADDEGIMVESLKEIISRQFQDEVEIATAKTGRTAIEQAENFHPDIVCIRQVRLCAGRNLARGGAVHHEAGFAGRGHPDGGGRDAEG